MKCFACKPALREYSNGRQVKSSRVEASERLSTARRKKHSNQWLYCDRSGLYLGCRRIERTRSAGLQTGSGNEDVEKESRIGKDEVEPTILPVWCGSKAKRCSGRVVAALRYSDCTAAQQPRGPEAQRPRGRASPHQQGFGIRIEATEYKRYKG